ncbi:hypothetical protein EPUS_08647 [Endocarpon pusillum Z07020]|uniref:Uncharacterized protein n=1 Tax=Endocarpon pusillum (strain Z07020 / HMAS-L-300199) TaxID=1263415 RepID=U1HGU4_ENDPU|nr:uncharacterized protein EPUS_08647 [Endocarpon pusillum Z07020]ERF69375.1 hypothetical protein EPUS_08647 [Endocarpon pusillum Z07020]
MKGSLVSLTRALTEALRDASPQQLDSSRGLLRKLEDTIHKAMSQAEDGLEHQESASDLPLMPVDRLILSIKRNAPKISALLDQKVDQTLRDGSRQSGEDPRIDDALRTMNIDNSDKLRSYLACWTLKSGHEEFSSGKNRSEASTRKYAGSEGILDAEKLSTAICKGGKIKAAATAYEEALAAFYEDHSVAAMIESDGAGMIVLLVFGNWARLSVEEMAYFGRLCGSDETIIKLLSLIKQKKFVQTCLALYPRLVDERRGPRKHARDTSVTNSIPPKSKKQYQSTPALLNVTNAESVPAGQENLDPLVPPYRSQPADDIDASGVETDWPRGRERDQFQGLNDLSWLGVPNLPIDSHLTTYASLHWDSNLTEFVPADNNETQLPIPSNRATQVPIADNVDYSAIQPQPATLENEPNQSQDGNCDRLGYTYVQHDELAANTPARCTISVF